MKIYYEPQNRCLIVANGAYGNATASVLQFDVGSAYHAPVFKNIVNKQGGEEGTFDYANQYLMTLTPLQQTQITRWYDYLHTMFYSTAVSMHEELLEKAFAQFLQLEGLHPTQVTEWLKEVLPTPKLMQEYLPDAEGIYSRAKTYIYQEYMELAALGLYTKLLLPIFGEYIRRQQIKLKTSNEAQLDGLVQPYIEQRLVEILDPLLQALPAIDRLRQFIEVSITGNNVDLTELVVGKKISEEDVVDYILAAIITRKLPSGALFGNDSNHLASRLATSIRSLIAPSGRETYRLTSEGLFQSNGDDVKGVFDDTYVHYPLSVGQIAILHHCTSEDYLLPRLPIDSNLYHQYVQAALPQAPYFNLFHVSVIATVLAKHFTTVILSHCDSITLLRLAVMSHLLIKETFPEIAQLVIATPKVIDGQLMADHLPLAKVSGSTLKLLEQEFPIYRNRTTLYINNHLEEIRENLMYVWQSLVPPCDEAVIPPHFLTCYADFICKAPYL